MEIVDKQEIVELALDIDETIKRVRSDEWRGNKPRENEIKSALLPLLNNDVDKVEYIFNIIKKQREY